jgi:hypothetical protein
VIDTCPAVGVFVWVRIRRPLNVRVAVPPEAGTVPPGRILLVVDDDRVNGGMTETSSTTSPREAFLVVDTDVKLPPIESVYTLVQVPSTVAGLKVHVPLVVDVKAPDVVTIL